MKKSFKIFAGVLIVTIAAIFGFRHFSHWI